MMIDSELSSFSLDDLSQVTQLSSAIIIEIVELGIMDPLGESPESWEFNTQMLMTAQRAFRLHQDLDIDWPGIVLAVSLIDEIEQLKNENQRLNLQLHEFIASSKITAESKSE